jgi:Holliday junction resolvase RusA-like endonuclease
VIKFTILGVPTAKGRPEFTVRGSGKSAHVHVITPEKTRVAEASLRMQALQYRPRKPLDGALHVTTVFVMPAPAHFDVDRSRDWPHVKPDDDNLRKLVLDALKGLFWHDDAQICGGESFKIYGTPPRTFVRIAPLGMTELRRVRAMIGDAVPQLDLIGVLNA